ncbi:hypothetical protein [Paraburkholderia sp. C35]|uniref:hypothetical protein n=1 Tax=Paraburkholderia sp. C35 TaxID=2126993 RepID=UPI001EF65CAF|nr:hypothetical protein [Paraburkholderia sp. C35]
MAVATRKAIEAGLVEPIDFAQGALSAARNRMSAVEALNLLQARIESTYSEDVLLALPDFYVFLIENDTWAFFHATTAGFDPDIVPEMPDVTTDDPERRSNIVVTSEAGLRAWLKGQVGTHAALQDTLVHVDAPSGVAKEALTQMLVHAEPVTVEAG